MIAYTREHLANFKTPRSVEFLDALPRNPGGKVVKPQLREKSLMDLDFRRRDRWRSGPRSATSSPPTRSTFPTKSYDTAEGFEQHRRWDKVLFDAGLSVITWPEKYGGRDATLLQWVVYEEEYFRAGAPGRASANGTSMLAPTLFAHGTEEQLDRVLPKMASGEEIWAQAWSEPESGSDLASLRSTATKTDGGWLLNGQKIWSSRAPFGDRAFGLFRSDPEAAAAQGPDLLHVRPEGRRRHRPADRPARRRHRVRRDLPRRRVRARRRRDRRRARRLARRDEHVEQRARHVAAQPRPVPRAGRAARRAVEGQSRSGLRRPGRRRVDQGAGLPAAHLRHRDPARRRRRARRRVVGDQGVLVGPRRRAAPDRAGPARRRRRAGRLLDRRACCSRSAARSTRAPTRFSATSSPSGCWACPGSKGRSELRSRRTAARLRRQHRRRARRGRRARGGAGLGRGRHRPGPQGVGDSWPTSASPRWRCPRSTTASTRTRSTSWSPRSGSGRWCVPGPVTESIAVAPVLLADDERCGRTGGRRTDRHRRAAAARAARRRRRLGRADPGRRATVRCATAVAGARHESVDPSRKLFDVTASGDAAAGRRRTRLRVRRAGHRRAAGRRGPGACWTPRSTTPSSAASSAG